MRCGIYKRNAAVRLVQLIVTSAEWRRLRFYVCLSVCPLDYSKSYVDEGIFWSGGAILIIDNHE